MRKRQESWCFRIPLFLRVSVVLCSRYRPHSFLNVYMLDARCYHPNVRCLNAGLLRATLKNHQISSPFPSPKVELQGSHYGLEIVVSAGIVCALLFSCAKMGSNMLKSKHTSSDLAPDKSYGPS